MVGLQEAAEAVNVVVAALLGLAGKEEVALEEAQQAMQQRLVKPTLAVAVAGQEDLAVHLGLQADQVLLSFAI